MLIDIFDIFDMQRIAKAQSAPSIAQATEERQGEQRFCDSPSQVCSDPNRC